MSASRRTFSAVFLPRDWLRPPPDPLIDDGLLVETSGEESLREVGKGGRFSSSSAGARARLLLFPRSTSEIPLRENLARDPDRLEDLLVLSALGSRGVEGDRGEVVPEGDGDGRECKLVRECRATPFATIERSPAGSEPALSRDSSRVVARPRPFSEADDDEMIEELER